MTNLLDHMERQREEFDRRAQSCERLYTSLAESLREVAERVLSEEQAEDTEEACVRALLRNGAPGGGQKSGGMDR